MQKRGATTALAIVMLVLGGLGLLASLAGVALRVSGMVETTPIFFVDAVMQILGKVGLLAGGVLILRRNSMAFPVTFITFCVSSIGTVIAWIAVNSSEIVAPGASEATRDVAAVGRNIGFSCVSILGVALYITALVYLRRPATRAEFAGISPSEDDTFD